MHGPFALSVRRSGPNPNSAGAGRLAGLGCAYARCKWGQGSGTPRPMGPVREIEVFLAWIFLRARQSRCTRACPKCPTAHRSVQRGVGARTAGGDRTAGRRWHCHWHYGVVNRGQRRRPGPAHGGQRRTQAAGRMAPPRRLRRNRAEITSERKRLHVSATLRGG